MCTLRVAFAPPSANVYIIPKGAREERQPLNSSTPRGAQPLRYSPPSDPRTKLLKAEFIKSGIANELLRISITRLRDMNVDFIFRPLWTTRFNYSYLPRDEIQILYIARAKCFNGCDVWFNGKKVSCHMNLYQCPRLLWHLLQWENSLSVAQEIVCDEKTKEWRERKRVQKCGSCINDVTHRIVSTWHALAIIRAHKLWDIRAARRNNEIRNTQSVVIFATHFPTRSSEGAVSIIKRQSIM